ncbi:hypothetical protein QW180_15605 [Vibrio sinaloensis]|nr:hypothetical protein [Vibrio sinaloensis]
MQITDESTPEEVVKADMQRLQMWSEKHGLPYGSDVDLSYSEIDD